ncbi:MULTISPECIES: hypothetical protein [Rhodococcus]|uniref:hypothetical protein n=1 Tax=Rhodococcus TaxID=1827 RepID=UPI002953A11C|nr:MULTISPECIES: hypothetical protein [Rhodococcus]MDV7246385.1 hypothetical protein [Rhodococcus oxybenzonivorans]MDV7337333.1 hypothetical protein [Rhodococcus oxybenzonivorans]MDV7348047.1 hypothetical protein [Rhodococcus oxybenzonivorans]MDV8031616.1 hypothetical protein [Rhodococcus sp. IEGM 27]
MGLFTDGKGRPELVMNPDVLLGSRAHFRPVDDEPEREETPKQRARRELKTRLGAEKRAREKKKEKTGDTNPE